VAGKGTRNKPTGAKGSQSHCENLQPPNYFIIKQLLYSFHNYVAGILERKTMALCRKPVVTLPPPPFKTQGTAQRKL
jgi:hypothetical protein